ncbi:MAG: transposase [Acidobacteria bacterium]|nr:transposase [Acidobacteriota bacterium]
MSVRRPGRAAGFAYLGAHTYLVTCCTYARRRYFARTATARQVLSQIRQAAGAWHLAVLAYCLMPDHLHLVVQGTRADANLQGFVSSFKQRSGFDHARTTDTRLWQAGYHDRVLRRDESVLTTIAYVLNNPVRARIVQRPEDYLWSGSDQYTMDERLTDIARGSRTETARRRR